MSNFGKSGGGGRRSSVRNDVPMLALVMTLSRTRTAVVADLSCTGICLKGGDLPQSGELLEIKLDQVAGFGSVVWSTGSQCGIAFEPALASTDVEALRIRAGKSKLSSMSVQERQALHEWLLGVSR
jgi:hypothetical protein